MDWKIEETEEGLKVECRYYEPAPRSIDVESDKRAIAVLEKAKLSEHYSDDRVKDNNS